MKMSAFITRLIESYIGLGERTDVLDSATVDINFCLNVMQSRREGPNRRIIDPPDYRGSRGYLELTAYFT